MLGLAAPVHFRDGSNVIKEGLRKMSFTVCHLLDYLEVLEGTRAFFQGQKSFTLLKSINTLTYVVQLSISQMM